MILSPMMAASLVRDVLVAHGVDALLVSVRRTGFGAVVEAYGLGKIVISSWRPVTYAHAAAEALLS